VTQGPFLNVAVHASVHPAALAAELRDGVASGTVSTRQLYISVRQARLWRAIAAAFSPARDDGDGGRAYERVNVHAATLLAGEPVHVIGLGCGDGAKERRLLDSLTQHGPLTATPVDVSLPLVLTAADLLGASAQLGRPVVCDLGLAASDLPAMVESADGRRIVTLYGILPGLDAAPALAAAGALLRPGDLLAVSANLLPPDTGALERVTAQYDNAPTRRWLGALLDEAGIDAARCALRIEALEDPGAGAYAGVGAWLDPLEPFTAELEAGPVDLHPDRPVRVLRSARHTPTGLAAIVEAAGLHVLAVEVSPSGEEGVLLAIR
jgi:hypothetical protein